MEETLRERVDALERAVTDGDCELDALAEDAEAIQRLEALESQLDEFEDRVAELEAATQALRGYVGNVRSVNRDVEQRAETALAKAQAVEAALDKDRSPAEQTGNPETAPTSADGGPNQQHTHHTETRCHACGRPHDTDTIGSGDTHQQQNSQFDREESNRYERAETATEFDRTATDSGEFQSTTETDETIPEQTEDTGTLQRVREML